MGTQSYFSVLAVTHSFAFAIELFFPCQEVILDIRELYFFSLCVLFKLLVTRELAILSGEFMEKMKRECFLEV